MNYYVILFALVLGVSLIDLSEAWRYYGRWGGYYPRYYPVYSWYSYPRYWRYWRRDASFPIEMKNRTECIYEKENEMLRCISSLEVVECKAKFSSPAEYMHFGIGSFDKSLTNLDLINISLYPRRLDNSAWLSDMVMENGTERRFSLYYSEEDLHYGFRLSEKLCYAKIVNLFRSSMRDELVTLDSKVEARLLGDLLMAEPKLADRPVKRDDDEGGSLNKSDDAVLVSVSKRDPDDDDNPLEE